MRKWINLITEGEVVSMGQHKFNKATTAYSREISDVIADMATTYATGKFIPIAITYIESGFDPKLAPVFYIDVDATVEAAKPRSHAITFLRGLRGFKYHKGDKWQGPWARKEGASFEEVRGLFSGRQNSEFGAYQVSRLGFGETYRQTYDDNGLGFHISVSGYDNRQQGKYVDVGHIIDNEADWQEVADMMAMINRAQMIRSVK